MRILTRGSIAVRFYEERKLLILGICDYLQGPGRTRTPCVKQNIVPLTIKDVLRETQSLKIVLFDAFDATTRVLISCCELYTVVPKPLVSEIVNRKVIVFGVYPTLAEKVEREACQF